MSSLLVEVRGQLEAILSEKTDCCLRCEQYFNEY